MKGKIIIPDDFVSLMLREKQLEMLVKALAAYTPKSEEEQEYKQLLDMLQTLALDEY